MPTTPTASAPAPAKPRPPATRGDVVVGILADQEAVHLVRVALAEAIPRRVSLRIVRVLPAGSGQDQVVAADLVAFAVARAAKRDDAVPMRFEVVLGDPVGVLLDRSLDAALLVVGADHEGAEVAAACREGAGCPVRTVPLRGGSASPSRQDGQPDVRVGGQ